MKKLHLGCGKRYIPGWINVDKISDNPNVVDDDVSILSSVVDDTVDIIYASHVLEHFGRHETQNILRCWYKKLKSGGLLRIAVPDFEAVCKRYVQTGYINELIGFTSGGQRHHYDYHKVVFDFEYLKNCLNEAGFQNVVRYDWRQTEHSHIDDYSQSYLPHMDKDNGTLMSLNIECTK